jgi:hypothetical protein
MCTLGVSFTFLAETNEFGAAAHGCILLSFKSIQRQKHWPGRWPGCLRWPSKRLRRSCLLRWRYWPVQVPAVPHLPFRAVLVVGNNVVPVVIPTVHNFLYGFDRMFSESFMYASISIFAGFHIADMEATDKHRYRQTSFNISHRDGANICGKPYPTEGGQYYFFLFGHERTFLLLPFAAFCPLLEPLFLAPTSQAGELHSELLRGRRNGYAEVDWEAPDHSHAQVSITSSGAVMLSYAFDSVMEMSQE